MTNNVLLGVIILGIVYLASSTIKTLWTCECPCKDKNINKSMQELSKMFVQTKHFLAFHNDTVIIGTIVVETDERLIEIPFYRTGIHYSKEGELGPKRSSDCLFDLVDAAYADINSWELNLYSIELHVYTHNKIEQNEFSRAWHKHAS